MDKGQCAFFSIFAPFRSFKYGFYCCFALYWNDFVFSTIGTHYGTREPNWFFSGANGRILGVNVKKPMNLAC
jgi:hypothetical protein